MSKLNKYFKSKRYHSISRIVLDLGAHFKDYLRMKCSGPQDVIYYQNATFDTLGHKSCVFNIDHNKNALDAIASIKSFELKGYTCDCTQIIRNILSLSQQLE